MADETQLERAIARAFRPQRRMSRRMFLRQTGRGAIVAGSALSIPAILAACGISPTASPSGAGASQGALPSAPAGTVDFANWPAYIDIDEETGDYPTIQKFQDESGITVNYTEAINDNEEFFGLIQPDLAAGNAPQYDIIVMTDWMTERMIRLGYLEELDHDQLPNFAANAQDLYRDPWWDGGNRYSIAWQSGLVGIGYNPELTGREITTFDDLLDPAFEGRVGMFSEMRDTMSMALLSLGVVPEEAEMADVERAQQKLLEAAQRGQFRNFYGNDYYDELANGNLALTMAWSGDVSQMKLYDNDAVEFVVPDTGSMLWTDSMSIPKNAPHPLDAHMMMNFWYDLENAVALTEYVGYYSPVRGVAERVAEDAEAAREEGDEEWAAALDVISETAFPGEDIIERSYTYKRLSEEEEAEWNELFNEVLAG
jgi:spermidine/putrescine transport system substrate-binding protein